MKTRYLTTILTFVAGAGVVATGVLAAKGHVRARDILNEAELEADMPTKDRFMTVAKLTWRDYAPAVTVGAVTIGIIFGLNHQHIKKEAALAGALAAVGAKLKNYDAATLQTVGKEKLNEIKQKAAKMSMPPMTGEEKSCYYESITKQYFSANEKDILKAECDLNRLFQRNQFITMAQYLALLPDKNIEISAADHEYGWYMDDAFDFNSSFNGDGYYISLNTSPEDVDGDHAAIVLSPSIYPCDPSDEWDIDRDRYYQAFYADDMKELNS